MTQSNAPIKDRKSAFPIIDWDGKTITKPGLYRGIPIARYHSADICDGPSISSSGLRTIFGKSPAHFWDQAAMNPKRAPQESKDYFTLGRAAHHLLFGEKLFSSSFVQQPDELPDPKTGEMKSWHGARTVCKEWTEKARRTGKDIVTAAMIDTVRGMAVSLGAHPFVQDGILRGLVEMSLIWRDKETGIWVKSRPDAIPTDSGDVCDLKTTHDIFRLDRAIRDHRYDIQAALVRWGFREVLKTNMASFTLMFVESSRPYVAEARQLADGDLDAGEKDARMALRTFAHCLKTGRWFGPSGTQRDAGTAYFPDYMRENSQFRRELLQREIGESK